MTRIGFALAALGLIGCGPSQSEVDKLRRRVTKLEQRVRTLERGKGPKRSKAKGRGRKSKMKAKVRVSPTAAVKVLGDARQVFLGAGDDRHAVPGMVPGGDYDILASFEAGSAVAVAGSGSVQAGQSAVVTCEQAHKRCRLEID